MAVDLIDLVPSLKREVEPPGSNVFASVTDAQWVGYLADAFWEARLDGFLTGYIVQGVDPLVTAPPIPGEVIPTSGTVEVDRAQLALVVLYAGIKILRNRILNMNTGFRAKAGGVEFEQQNSATMLAEMLKQLRATKDRIIDALDAGETDVMVLDAFSTRVLSTSSYYGGPELTG
jgi:hypothetical protein